MKIIKVWESPCNEGTEYYRLGQTMPRSAYKKFEWTVGEICQAHGRVLVFCEEDHWLRVSLPLTAVALEYGDE